MHANLALLLALWLCHAAAAAAAAAAVAPPTWAAAALPAAPVPAKGTREGKWTVAIREPIAAPIDRVFDFWWDLQNTKRFVPAVNNVRSTAVNASYEAFEISQLIPFPVQRLPTVARGGIVVLRRTPGFISSHTTGLITGPPPAGASRGRAGWRGVAGQGRGRAAGGGPFSGKQATPQITRIPE
jgi:hypothetical protein